MTKALKTTSILAFAAALSAASLLLSPAKSPAGAKGGGQKASVGVLHMNAKLASSYVLQGEHDSYMAITLTAPENPGQERPDVDVAVVVDRSGSMEGEKLAQAKLAARQLIGNLHQNDRFSIVAYGTEVDVLVPTTLAGDGAKQAALDAISAIYTDGGTNLSGGLQAAQSQLVGLTGVSSRVQRIVLLSDGQANEGIVNPADLARLAANSSAQGVSITTVGIGLDFDEKSMTGIALSGGGNYYFAESADMLATLFDTELQKLGATAATQIRLQLKGAENVQIREIIGHSMVRQGDAWVVSVPDMHAGETRKVVVALRIQAKGAGLMPLTEIAATYIDAADGSNGLAQNEVFASVTANQQVVNQNRDTISNRLIERALTAQAIDEATLLYEQGRGTEAQKLINTRTVSAQNNAMAMDDAEFAEEMNAAQEAVNHNFAIAPGSTSTGGKRARKANRNAAYKMMK